MSVFNEIKTENKMYTKTFPLNEALRSKPPQNNHLPCQNLQITNACCGISEYNNFKINNETLPTKQQNEFHDKFQQVFLFTVPKLEPPPPPPLIFIVSYVTGIKG